MVVEEEEGIELNLPVVQRERDLTIVASGSSSSYSRRHNRLKMKLGGERGGGGAKKYTLWCQGVVCEIIQFHIRV